MIFWKCEGGTDTHTQTVTILYVYLISLRKVKSESNFQTSEKKNVAYVIFYGDMDHMENMVSVFRKWQGLKNPVFWGVRQLGL